VTELKCVTFRKSESLSQLLIWPVSYVAATLFGSSLALIGNASAQRCRVRLNSVSGLEMALPESAATWAWAESTSPITPFNRPMCAHSAVMSPRPGPCSSAPFCTSGVQTSRAFWSNSGHASKVLTTLVVVECSQVRLIERKEEMRACPATTKTNLTEHRTWALAGILPFFSDDPRRRG